jgi:hypothetical protein
MPTTREYNAAFDALYAAILADIRADVPSLYQGMAERELPKHRDLILDLAKKAVDAATSARLTKPDLA